MPGLALFCRGSDISDTRPHRVAGRIVATNPNQAKSACAAHALRTVCTEYGPEDGVFRTIGYARGGWSIPSSCIE
jgi:hypothetical protein